MFDKNIDGKDRRRAMQANIASLTVKYESGGQVTFLIGDEFSAQLASCMRRSIQAEQSYVSCEDCCEFHETLGPERRVPNRRCGECRMIGS